jgi:hypothetical protein
MRHCLAVLVIVALAGCGSSGNDPTPTQPTPPPAPTPTPVPTPTPNPFAAACGTPLPAFEDSYGFGVKVQLEPTPNKKVLNASPTVRNSAYCAAAGMPNRSICNTRQEDAPQRAACDHYLSGMADTGKPGPNWFQDVDDDGKLVKCGEEGTDCKLKPENQYLLDVYAPGTYVACGGKGSPGTCGGCVLAKSTWGIIHKNPAGLCTAE